MLSQLNPCPSRPSVLVPGAVFGEHSGPGTSRLVKQTKVTGWVINNNKHAASIDGWRIEELNGHFGFARSMVSSYEQRTKLLV